jgi:hypothetical protein
MYRFKYVFLAILVRMAAYILDYVSFDKRDFVYRYEFSWLNLHMLVMLPTYLFITVFL